MADTKISDLPAVSAPSATDVVPVVSDGVTKKVTLSDLVLASGVAGGGGGALVQVVNTQTGAKATGATVIPYDDTIPQNTEGDEYMTLAITPTSATNILKIEVVAFLSSGVGNWVMAALFQDTVADALAVSMVYNATAGASENSVFTHYMTAGTTSAIMFKVRAGGLSAGTTTFNGTTAARRFGGVMASSITISEIDLSAAAVPAAGRVFLFTSPATPVAGDQLPEFYADRALTLDFVQASGAARPAVVTVDVKKNGTSIFPTTTKPDAPAAGGLGTRRVPDTVGVSQGDRLTVSFSGTDFTDSDKILVYIGVKASDAGGGGTSALSGTGPSAISSPVNMTTDGTIDYIAIGTHGTSLPRSYTLPGVKLSGGGVFLETFFWLGGGQAVTIFTQNNGTAVTATGADYAGGGALTNNVAGAGVYVSTSGVGYGFTISAPALPTSRRLRLYIGHYSCVLSVTAHLSDDSVTPVTLTSDSGVTTAIEKLFEFNFASVAAGVNLVVTATVTTNRGGGPNVKPIAATLS